MRLRPRRLRTLACLTGLVALAAAPAVARADDPPANDVRAQALTIPIAFNRGVQVLGETTDRIDLANDDEDETDPDLHTDDPALFTGNAGSTCLDWGASRDVPFRGWNTVWYTLEWPRGPSGAQRRPSERTYVEIASSGIQYRHAIAVLRNGVLTHCEAQNEGVTITDGFAGFRSHVSFVALEDDANADPTYEIAIVARESVSARYSAGLAVRAVDMAAPRISVVARPAEAQPGKPTTFEVTSPIDYGSGIGLRPIEWSARWDGGPPMKAPVPNTSNPRVATIKWPAASSLYPKPSEGRVAVVTATIADKEGNRSRVTLTFTVKDRVRPIARLAAVGVGPNTLRLTGRCSEAARLTFTARKNGAKKSRPIKPRAVWRVRARRDAVATVDLPTRGQWNLKATCTDRANNKGEAAISFIF